MVKPTRLKHGDKVAIVSLSWGGLGDDEYIHKYHILYIPMFQATPLAWFYQAPSNLNSKKNAKNALQEIFVVPPDTSHTFSAKDGKYSVLSVCLSGKGFRQSMWL